MPGKLLGKEPVKVEAETESVSKNIWWGGTGSNVHTLRPRKTHTGANTHAEATSATGGGTDRPVKPKAGIRDKKERGWSPAERLRQGH